MKLSPMAGLSLAVVLCGVASSLSPARAQDSSIRNSPVAANVETPASAIWNGFYLGGFAGGSIANAPQGYSVSSPELAAVPTLIPTINAAGSQNLSGRGAELGIEGGYNWRLPNAFVIGIAGDASVGGPRGSRTSNGTVPFFGIPFSITQGLNRDWRASLRLQAGVTPIDNLMIYATGGPTLAQFTYKQGFWDFVNETENATFRSIRPGWTLGAGAEWAVTRNWSVKAEYRHSQYSAVTGMGGVLLTDGTTADIAHSSGRIREDSLRIGVGFHFE